VFVGSGVAVGSGVLVGMVGASVGDGVMVGALVSDGKTGGGEVGVKVSVAVGQTNGVFVGR
jgi:hypothetical protein